MFRCHVCGATEAHQALVDEVFMINGKYVLVEGIPAKYLDRNSCMVFPGSAGVSPALEAARMAALPGDKLPDHNGIKIVSGYLVSARCGEAIFSRETTERGRRMVHGEAQLCAP